jgi:PAS domain S-box-containing protein
MDSRRRLRILIIEDSAADRAICKSLLLRSAAASFDFAEATTSAAGIEIARDYRPDCILLDFNLPDIDGLAALTELRPFPVVMLTAFGCEEVAVKAMKMGAMDYLPKARLADEVLAMSVLNAIQRFETEQRYGALLEAIPLMVWSSGPEGDLEYVNQRWFDYTGLKLEQAGRLGWNLVHPEDRERTLQAWDRAKAADSVFEIENRLRRASDESYRWHLVRAVPIRTPAGKIIHWLGTCTEIEEQKQAERINLAREKLEGIGVLAGGVAHDFNNLLAVILGRVSLALESLETWHPARQMLEGVVEAGERGASLTRRMLAYAGKAPFFDEVIGLDQFLRDAVEGMRNSIPYSIRLQIESCPDLPAIRSDTAQLRHVVTEMLTNAVEAIGEDSSGTIWVRASTVEVAGNDFLREGFARGAVADGKYVALEVKDTGCGMNEETQKRIFDPFFSTKFMGRGLGLAALEGFVRSSGGGVEVRSTPGKGTHIRVLLPVEVSKNEERANAI